MLAYYISYELHVTYVQGRRNGLFIGASGKFFQRGDWPTADFADFFKGGSQIIGASQDARKPGSAGPAIVALRTLMLRRDRDIHENIFLLVFVIF